MLVHGPLGQVGELVSTVGRRLHLAVEELRRAAGGGVRAGHRGGRSVERLLQVALAVMRSADGWLTDCESCLEVYKRERSGKGEAGAAEPGQESDSPLARALGLRWSYTVAELLPPLRKGVQAFAELAQRLGDAGDAGGRQAEPLALVGCGGETAMTAFHPVRMLLFKYMHAGAAEGPERSGAGGSTGAGEGGGGGADGAPWRQLLLRDVRLMELLGAAVDLYRLGLYWFPRLDPGESNEVWYGHIRNGVCSCMALAAAAFPAEFRAAAGGAAPCFSLPAVCAMLSGAGATCDAQLGVAARVLEGWEPSAEEAREVACGCVSSRAGTFAVVAGFARTLVSPTEARAAVAAAAAAPGS